MTDELPAVDHGFGLAQETLKEKFSEDDTEIMLKVSIRDFTLTTFYVQLVFVIFCSPSSLS